MTYKPQKRRGERLIRYLASLPGGVAPNSFSSNIAASSASMQTSGGRQERLEEWDGIGRQVLSLDTTPLIYWSRNNVPRTFEFSWRGVAPLPGGAVHRGAVGLSLPGVGVLIKLSDYKIVDAHAPVNISKVVTPQSTKSNPVRVELPYGGDVEVHLNALQTTPRGVELMVVDYANSGKR